MRLSQLFGAFAPGRSDEVAGVTIDVMTGVVGRDSPSFSP